jgi:hypothetical protein
LDRLLATDYTDHNRSAYTCLSVANSYFLYSLAMRNIDREFSLIRTDRRVSTVWPPLESRRDVYRSPDGWIVKVDLAGSALTSWRSNTRVASDDSWLSTRHAYSRRLRLPSDGNHLQPFRKVDRVSGAD